MIGIIGHALELQENQRKTVTGIVKTANFLWNPLMAKNPL